MFRPGLIAAAVLSAGLAVVQPTVKAPIEQAPVNHVAPATRRRELAPSPRIRRRGKGAQAKPAKRSKRLHISRRTRRKHRRAA